MDREKLRNDLECITQKRPLSDGESVADVLSRLDAMASLSGNPERLQHYLSKRSYLKALEWLDNPEAPHQV